MATRAIGQGGATALPAIAEAEATLRAAIAGLSYAALGTLVDVAIARLDEIDGDPDFEPEAPDDDGDDEEQGRTWEANP